MKTVDDVYENIVTRREADRDLIERLREALQRSIDLHGRDKPFMHAEDQHDLERWRQLVKEAKR